MVLGRRGMELAEAAFGQGPSCSKFHNGETFHQTHSDAFRFVSQVVLLQNIQMKTEQVWKWQ